MQPDDYYNNGLFEMARFGTNTLIKNNLSTEQNKTLLEKYKRKYPKIIRKINRLVEVISNQVSKCDPVALLSFCSDLFLMSNLGISSEFQLSKDRVFSSRMTEYIQSLLVSMPNKYKAIKKDPSKRFFQIEHNVAKLYKLIDEFYLCWSANIEDFYPNYDSETRNVIVESQLLYMVRGQRYQIFEVEYYERLLKTHNNVFVELFNLSYNDIIDGIKKLQYSLSQAKLDAANELGKIMDSFFESGETDVEKFRKANPIDGQRLGGELFGTKLHNVTEITGWPEKFIRCLSWKLNECTNFNCEKDFSGWPIIDLPIQKRPFIKINNTYYCFDYYSFIDNFYRSVQKAISRECPNYKWSDFQKEASENMVADVFAEILPNAVIYKDNYYPKNKSLKKLNENDIIINYYNTLLIVEVKAGSFVFTPPISDFENHITSYKNLIEKADHQCKNTYDYLTSMDNAILYNQSGNIKAQIDMTKIQDIFMLSVTIDNINNFAARAEKLNFLKLKCNAISLSIDDLMVYSKYFDSPLIFLHFLKQRRQATLESKLALNDELDHLGMYIKHNMYCIQLEDYPDDSKIIFEGYREDLDKYFGSLYHPHLKLEKPTQQLPERFVRIIDFLENKPIENKVKASAYLLDFSTDAKEQLCESISYTLQRQNHTKNMLAFSFMGVEKSGIRCTIFVKQPGIHTFSEKYKREYVLSALAWNEEENRMMLEFEFNAHNDIIGLKFSEFTMNDFKEGEYEIALHQGKDRAIKRVQLYLRQHGIINDADTCPCASGKTYLPYL